MGNDFKKAAMDLLNSEAGVKLTGKKDEIEKLVSSADGQKIKAMLDGDDGKLMAAVKSGDISALKSKLNDILKTEEGARLAKQLSEMMKS